VANSAVWNDDAVLGALESATFWVKGLPFVKSLSGDWKFFLAPNPNSVPVNFYGGSFPDSEWKSLPGICIHIDDSHTHTHTYIYILAHTHTDLCVNIYIFSFISPFSI